MPMQDTINEIYRMRQEADNRERQELEDKIKQCDLNLFASAKDKSEPDEEFRAGYLQRGEMLKQYRWKYGKKAEEQLRDQLEEARKAYVKQYEAEGLLKSQNGQINELKKQLSEMEATVNAHAHEIMDIKRHILDELYKFPTVELWELLKAQSKELKAKVEELTRENNNAKKEQKKAEGELEAVKKKQAEQWQWMITLLCVISTLTSSTTGAQQKVDPKNDCVKPMKVYY